MAAELNRDIGTDEAKQVSLAPKPRRLLSDRNVKANTRQIGGGER
ncbi:hypothetical protein [Mycolicibacterium neoaurum]|nr:hypothetical protein [Mycolicibacterium neoaurum]